MNKMLQTVITTILFVICSTIIHGQGINYQAVLRNDDGSIMANQSIDLHATILDDNISVFEESFQTVTDAYGLINIQIGRDNVDFENIDWSSKKHSLSISVNGSFIGESPFSVVPYSKSATSMLIEHLIDVQTSDIQNGDLLIYQDGSWVNSPNTHPPAQTLNITGTTISISDGNSISLDEIITGGDGWGSQTANTGNSIDGDGTAGSPLELSNFGAGDGQVLKWNGNEWAAANDDDTQASPQTLSLSGSDLSISDGNTVDIQDLNTDEQTLELSGTSLSISGGNTINLDQIVTGGDGWGSQTANTDASLSGDGTVVNPLSIASQGANVGQVLKWNGNAWEPNDDEDTDTDTDNQTLSLSGSNLSIANGNSVNLALIDTDTDAQTLSLSGNSLSISNGNSVILPDPGQGTITEVIAGTGLSGGGDMSDVTIHANTTSPIWNANKILGKTVEITNPEFGQVLAYDSSTDKFINAFQLDADFVPFNYGGVNTLSSLAPVVSNNAFDVNPNNVSGNMISGDPFGSHIAMDGNEIMAKDAEDVIGDLYLQNEGGNVSIGAFGGNPSHILHVYGVARSTSSTWATSSDKRVKENVREVQSALDKIMNLRPVRFDWKSDYKAQNKALENNKIGFIAQEVEQVIPEMVSEISENTGEINLDDFKVLNMDPLFPLLVRSIQEQQETINKQQEQINELKSLIESIATNKE